MAFYCYFLPAYCGWHFGFPVSLTAATSIIPKGLETWNTKELKNDFNSQVLLICRLSKYDLCARVCGDGKRDDVVDGEKIVQTCLGFAIFLVKFGF